MLCRVLQQALPSMRPVDNEFAPLRSCAEWSILAGNADVAAAMIVGGWKVVMIAAARRSGERSVGCGETAGDSSHRFDLNQLVTSQR